MYREIGLLLVLLLPIAILYLSRQDNLQQPTQSKLKKNKKKNKKKSAKATATTTNNTNNDISNSSATTDLSSTIIKDAVSEKPALKPTSTISSLNDGDKHHLNESNTPRSNQPAAAPQPQPEPKTKNTSTKEVDEHMDLTTRYSRVMRIRTETPDEPLSPVPYEDGWNQVKTAKPQQTRSTQPKDEPLTKKQRENQVRAAKKKELKAQADAIQEQRLRQHQRHLEKEKIAAFYSTGAGKHTQWGSKPRNQQDQVSSSRTPSQQPDLDDQLIWD